MTADEPIEASYVRSALRWASSASWLLDVLDAAVRGTPFFGVVRGDDASVPGSAQRTSWVSRLRGRLRRYGMNPSRRVRRATSVGLRAAAAGALAEADRLLWKVAAKWATFAWRYVRGAGASCEYADMHQAALVGLYDAALRFDADRGYHFSTYCRWYLHSAVNDPDARASVVHVPGQERWKLRRLHDGIARGATVSEAVFDLQTPEWRLDAIQSAASACGEGRPSPGTHAAAEGTPTTLDTLTDAATEDDRVDTLDRSLLSDIVREEVDALPTHHRQLVIWHYGLDMDTGAPISIPGVGGRPRRAEPAPSKDTTHTYAQICRRTGKSAAWVKTHMGRAKAALTASLLFRLGALGVGTSLTEGAPLDDEDVAWIEEARLNLTAGLLSVRHAAIARRVLAQAGVSEELVAPAAGTKLVPSKTAPSRQTIGSAASASRTAAATALGQVAVNREYLPNGMGALV